MSWRMVSSVGAKGPMVPRAETNDPRLMQEHARQEQEIIMQAHMLEDSCLALQKSGG